MLVGQERVRCNLAGAMALLAALLKDGKDVAIEGRHRRRGGTRKRSVPSHYSQNKTRRNHPGSPHKRYLASSLVPTVGMHQVDHLLGAGYKGCRPNPRLASKKRTRTWGTLYRKSSHPLTKMTVRDTTRWVYSARIFWRFTHGTLLFSPWVLRTSRGLRHHSPAMRATCVRFRSSRI